MSQAIRFSNPETERFGRHIVANAQRGLPMVPRDRHADDKGVVIAAPGPSLNTDDVFDRVRDYVNDGYHVLAIKEAITYCRDNGIHVDYSANMDPTRVEVERTPVYPDVTYCLASSCHPDLYDHILDNGGRVEVYHSACGYTHVQFDPGFVIDVGPKDRAVFLGEYEFQTQTGASFCPVACGKVDEVSFYQRHYPHGDTMCGGFTVANRALALCRYMGFPHVVMAGTDFGWRRAETDTYYADFVTAEPVDKCFMSDEGKVDGYAWRTRPDLLASAVDVAKKIKIGEVDVLGDSLAVALSKCDDDYIERICRIE